MENIECLAKSIIGQNAEVISSIQGGMMNKSFLVQNGEEKFILYVPTEQANEMVDRLLEKQTQEIAEGLSITSKTVYFDVKTGIKARRFIEGKTLDKLSEFDYQKVAALMHALHSSKEKANQDYRPFDRFLGYEKEAKSYFEDLGKDYELLRDSVFSMREYLESRPLTLAHNDAQKSNIVSSIDEYMFIDFEFSANNDPLYDVACFGNGSVEEGHELLKAYRGDKLTKEDEKVYFLWRIFISLQWHDVALIKHARGEGKTHGYDFSAVAAFFLANANEAHQRLLELD